LFIYENGLIKNPLSDIIGILLVVAPDLASTARAHPRHMVIFFVIELTKNSLPDIIELLYSIP